MTRIDQQNALARLVGARLTSVQFVLDYLILGFDEKGAMTCLVWPELVDKDQAILFCAPGYRDALCSQLEATVDSATMDDNEVIHIIFASGCELLVNLRLCLREGERAILTGPEHYLFVF